MFTIIAIEGHADEHDEAHGAPRTSHRGNIAPALDPRLSRATERPTHSTTAHDPGTARGIGG